MRVLILLVLAGCAFDPDAYDIHGLSDSHQAAFRLAMVWSNINRGSSFYEDPIGDSVARYGYTKNGLGRQYFMPIIGPFGFPTGELRSVINFQEDADWQADNYFQCIAIQELGHHHFKSGRHSSDPTNPMHFSISRESCEMNLGVK